MDRTGVGHGFNHFYLSHGHGSPLPDFRHHVWGQTSSRSGYFNKPSSMRFSWIFVCVGIWSSSRDLAGTAADSSPLQGTLLPVNWHSGRYHIPCMGALISWLVTRASSIPPITPSSPLQALSKGHCCQASRAVTEFSSSPERH